MNKRQARAYALGCLWAEVLHHIGNGSEWLERPLHGDRLEVDQDGCFSEADQERIADAVREIANELERKSIRLRTNEAERKLKKLAKVVKP